MHQSDQGLHEVSDLLEGGRDSEALRAIARLADQTSDPVLRRELGDVVANGRASSRRFRKEWDRLYLAYGVGR